MPTVTLQPGPDPDRLEQYLDVETARRITGPEYHYSVSYMPNPDGRDEYNILVNGDYAGEINLYRDEHRAHIGFWLREGYRGQGAIKEALRLVLAIYEGQFTIVRMTVWANNEPAMALMTKLGMKETKRERFPIRHREQFGEWASHRSRGYEDLVQSLNQELQLQT